MAWHPSSTIAWAPPSSDQMAMDDPSLPNSYNPYFDARNNHDSSNANGHAPYPSYIPSELDLAMEHPSTGAPQHPLTINTNTNPNNNNNVYGNSYDVYSSSTGSSSFDSARFRVPSSSLDPSARANVPSEYPPMFAHSNRPPQQTQQPSSQQPQHPHLNLMGLGPRGTTTTGTPGHASPHSHRSGTSTPISTGSSYAYPGPSSAATTAPSSASLPPYNSAQHSPGEYMLNTALSSAVPPSALHHFQNQLGLGASAPLPSASHMAKFPPVGPPVPSQQHRGNAPELDYRRPPTSRAQQEYNHYGELTKLPPCQQPSPIPDSAAISFIRPYLDQYMNAPNRIAFGERTIIVMSSKVAQKSYGTEKRFLCPPPTAIMIGKHWFTELDRIPKSLPPRVVVSISGEVIPNETPVEWTTPTGKPFDVSDPPREDTTYIGRAIGKQLFISDADERRKKVEAVVQVFAPPADDEEPERPLGTFLSKPIKVISKPSKKRQSAKNLELCINHGNTVALFHRLRSQTVSTKYLCVSGSGSSYKGSDGAPLRGVDSRMRGSTPSFVARTNSWDSFIIYIVDVTKPGGVDGPPAPPPHPDYPSPPPNAIPFTQNGAPIPIYYNQTVALQCLISGVVSPVLIVRKVDHGTVIVGGGVQDGMRSVPDSYCADGEVCGDPVSQLHKIAFEVYEPGKPAPPPGSPGTSGAFLSCMGEKVNTYRPTEGRTWNSPNTSPGSHSPSLPGSPVPITPNGSGLPPGGGDYFPPVPPTYNDYPDATADGGRVKRTKRGSVHVPSPVVKTTSKARRRVNSAGSLNSRTANKGVSKADDSISSGALWAVDIGETAVWTIVGTEQIRYDFYVPPIHREGSSSPISRPSIPTKPVTPFPTLVKCLPSDRAAEAAKGHTVSRIPKGGTVLTLYGANFDKSEPLSVFFGPHASPSVDFRCHEVLSCVAPDANFEPGQKVPIFLVRSDGVVFPTNVMYHVK